MEAISRKHFLIQMGLMSTATLLFSGCNFIGDDGEPLKRVQLQPAKKGEDIKSLLDAQEFNTDSRDDLFAERDALRSVPVLSRQDAHRSVFGAPNKLMQQSVFRLNGAYSAY